MTTLLADIATLCLNEVTLPGLSDDILTTITKPTPLQSKILAALNVDPTAGVSIRHHGLTCPDSQRIGYALGQ